jgi:hypothetical protein
MKRTIALKGLDMVLELTKVTTINGSTNMIHLDQLKDGTWRLIYNRDMIPDFTKLESLDIVREG